MKRLLVFRGFSHDPQSILAAVYHLALVGVKLCLNIGILELSVASFAHSYGRRRRLLYDPQFPLLHNCSLAHSAGGRNTCGNQTAPLPGNCQSYEFFPRPPPIHQRAVRTLPMFFPAKCLLS
jgi:hypothetical protein